jgi:hypothetical protein
MLTLSKSLIEKMGNAHSYDCLSIFAPVATERPARDHDCYHAQRRAMVR